jgi:two-component system LytT family response regulator
MGITAILVDDEQDSRSVLKHLLKTFCPHVTVLGEAGNITAAFDLITALRPQVVFLDIQMAGGNGFSLLKKFQEIPFEVIFVTGYNKYAIEAIKLSALHYLMKPVEVDDLKFAVDKLAWNILKNQNSQEQLVNVIINLEGAELEKRIMVHSHDRVKFLVISDISHFEGERNYTTIHMVNKMKYTSTKNLGEFEEMLGENAQFFRISKSYIINLNHVTSYTKGGPCVLTLSSGLEFEISRRIKQEFLDRMQSRSSQ